LDNSIFMVKKVFALSTGFARFKTAIAKLPPWKIAQPTTEWANYHDSPQSISDSLSAYRLIFRA